MQTRGLQDGKELASGSSWPCMLREAAFLMHDADAKQGSDACEMASIAASACADSYVLRDQALDSPAAYHPLLQSSCSALRLRSYCAHTILYPRRIRRDVMDRGRDVLAVLAQYERTVKPSFEEWILPTRKFADIIVRRPCSADAPCWFMTQVFDWRLGTRPVRVPIIQLWKISPSWSAAAGEVNLC